MRGLNNGELTLGPDQETQGEGTYPLYLDYLKLVALEKISKSLWAPHFRSIDDRAATIPSRHLPPYTRTVEPEGVADPLEPAVYRRLIMEIQELAPKTQRGE